LVPCRCAIRYRHAPLVWRRPALTNIRACPSCAFEDPVPKANCRS
jgi:hypothetical protein